MSCQRCQSERIASVNAKCKDMFRWESNEDSTEGYAHTPGGEIGNGDYVDFKYCLECGQIQDIFPALGKFEGEDEEW